MLESLNTLVNHSGYFLSSSADTFGIVEDVGSPSVRLLLGLYYQLVTEGNLISNLTKHTDMVGHLHVAEVPGRHEPGTSGSNFVHVLRTVRDAGYGGYVGLEYVSSGDSRSSMDFISNVVVEVNR